MAPLTPPHRFQQVHQKLFQPLPTTHRLGISHAQTYQRFFVLSILNVVILVIPESIYDACRQAYPQVVAQFVAGEIIALWLTGNSFRIRNAVRCCWEAAGGRTLVLWDRRGAEY